ncbi:protein NLRC5 isoform X2 [Onychostoma macrolepis]|uniref:protein NLRC5 isoform X2 n=1 Tax=Onychostoma macrolepis TaxID=369639 RepID=UPI00272C7FFC|nr:protein NLRC5 isoform X2 [Onychostoma macrolepis]
MSEERGNNSPSEMSVSEEQRGRSGSEVSSSESVKSDQSKGDVPLFNEETPTKSEKLGLHVSFSDKTPSQAKSERSGSPVFSSVSMKSDHSKGDGPNFSEKTPSSSKSEKSGSDVVSSVSVKSDHSKGDGPNFCEKKTSIKRSGSRVSFSEETRSRPRSVRSGSHVSSSVSVKSDHSKGDGPNFREETPCNKSVRSGSHVSSSVSVKSDHSKGDGPNFSEKKTSPSKSVRSGSHVSSSVSLKSDHSKGDGPNFSEKTPCNKSERSDSHVSSYVSMKSDHSKGDGPNFNEKTPTPYKINKGQKTTVNIGEEIKRWEALKEQKGLKSDVELASFLLNRVQFEKSDSNYKNYRNRKNFRENLLWIFKDLENKIIVFLKNELEKFKKILKRENTQYFVQDFIEEMRDIKEAALDMTLFFMRDMKQAEAADALQDELVLIHQRPLKSNLKKKHQSVSEGIAKQGDSKLLKNIYTDLYMTLGVSKHVNTQHEVRQVQAADRRHESEEIPVECKNLFEAPEQDKEIRTVLTKGVAGIGKSISVQKFIVDWADGNENKDITFIFPLAFREMNLKENEKQSLTNLISQFFPEIKGLNLARNDKFKFLFILDGLDECRLPLNFEDNETCRDVSSQVSLDVLLTNLIKGNLLPSALIWITTRPAAAIKIPPECIDRVTEVQGFNDAQKKEEYFRKRFTDVDLANKIIDNVKQSKSLFIMCYIPVFCWISATVLQNILEEKRKNDLKNNKADDASKTLRESNTEDTPKTLTQMYTHFLRFQILQSLRKYDGKYRPDVSWDKNAMLSLGKLAFHQLQRNNLLFYDTDLEACGIDASQASVYSGMCTQMFKEEKGIILGTTFCFVHLSIQEFIAALYAHLFLDINKKSVFAHESTEQENKNETMTDLLKTAVDKALESETGHLDLFLRFLLGLSLQTNRPLLRGLLTQQEGNDQNYKEIVQYIKQKLEANLSPERSINLFYCLNELNDQTLVKEIQTQLREGSLSSAELSPGQWSAVAFVLLTSEEEMEEFELQKFKKSDECFFRLLEVVKISKRALLNDCDLTDESCSNLAKALGSENNLIELNMSKNTLQDSGVEQLYTGLENITCKLEILKLSECDLTGKSCSALASVLSSDSSSLKDLDLSNNNLQDSGVKLLSDGLKENCKLEILRLSDCSITEEGYKALASALRSNPSHLIELDLTGNDPGQSGVRQLIDLQHDPNCQLKTLLRFLGPAADEACQYVAGVVDENPLLLRELNLSEHKLDMKLLAPLLKDKHCKLNILVLNNSSIKDEDCRVLAEALNSNPSNLKELDLTGTKLRDSGMKIFSTLFKNEQCRLEKLKSNCICITKEGCAALATAFNSNPSNLKELDLSETPLGDSGVTEISKLLGNSQCTLNILRMSECNITEEGYKALASALRSNPSHLIELDLTGNDPGQSGVEQLLDLIKEPDCKLNLRFLGPAADEACRYVTGIVGKNPLLLRELNLSGRELGDTRVNQITALLQDKHCKLNTLTLNNNRITAEGCAALTLSLNSNPSNLIELDLSGNKLGNSGIKEISPLLKNTQCRLEKLKLSDCSITEEGYKALASALRSNPSHLIELDLTGNDPGPSGVKGLTDLLLSRHYKLQTIRFLKSSTAEEACDHLTKALGTSPLLLKELDLNEDKLGDLDGMKLSALLMDSHSKVEKIKFRLNNCELTEKSCSVLATVLSSKTILKEMNLNNSRLLNSGVKEICEGLKNPVCELKILKLSKCDLTEESCSALASVLSSDSSSLKNLDLSNINLQDSGVKLLSDGLKENCKLEKLRLSDCSITEESYKTLTSALASNSHLIELDLRGNDPGQSGVKLIMDFLQSGWSKLKNISFLRNSAAEEACKYLTEALGENPLLMQEMDLSRIKLGDLDWEKISALLVDSHCKVKKIKLNDIKLNKKSCLVLATVLSKNNTLKEMDLSKSHLLDSGVKEICEGLKKPVCKLKILRLSDCSITEEGYKALASALRSNPSHLIELDLTGNDPGESGVEQLIKVQQNQSCKLETLRFLQSPADEACQYVTGIVRKNPLLLRELNLSGQNLNLKKFNLLTALLKDKHCNINRLQLCDCGLTEESCSALATVLRSNSSLKELDMSNNNLQDSGVKKLQMGLENAKCTLEKLRLSKCGITEAGYTALASALRSNPSHLIELDLTGNDPGQSGVKELNNLLQDKHYKLKTLRFLSSAADEACQYAMKVQGKNPLLLRELNLSENKLGDTRVNQITALLQDKHCKLNIIHLCKCSITEKQCLILTSALKSNSSHLKELNLSGNKLGDGGVENLGVLLSNSQCKLEKLNLCGCSITENQCAIMMSALFSNFSHLRELDLSDNKIKNTGVKILCDVLKDSHCKLERLRLSQCEITDEGCSDVTSALKSNPSHLRELNLSENTLGDSGVKNLSDLLMNPQCKLKNLDLCNCSITEKQCLMLTSALKSNPSHLRELDLSENKVKDKGVKHLCDVLKDSRCKLEKLSLKDCGITDVACLAQSLAETNAQRFLKELDLRKNKIGDSVKQLGDVIQDSNCNLSLDKENWVKAGLNYLGGLFRPWSKTQEPVKSTEPDPSSGGMEEVKGPGQSSHGSHQKKSGSSV